MQLSDDPLLCENSATPQLPRIAKAGYAFCAAITLIAIALWIIGPIIIAQAYHSNSLPFLNAAIARQNEYPLSEDISACYRIMAPSTVLVAWMVIPLVHMIWRGQADSQTSADRERVDSPNTVSCVIAVSCYSVLILASLFVLIVFQGKTYLSI